MCIKDVWLKAHVNILYESSFKKYLSWLDESIMKESSKTIKKLQTMRLNNELSKVITYLRRLK